MSNYNKQGAYMNSLNQVLMHKGITNAKQQKIIELVTMGLSNAEISNQLFISERSVKQRLTMIYNKMGLKSRAQLIVWCLPHLGYVA